MPAPQYASAFHVDKFTHRFLEVPEHTVVLIVVSILEIIRCSHIKKIAAPMPTNHQLDFLKEKIQDLGSAIFFNLSDSVLKFPTSLVNSMQVDDYGYVWFWVQKPRQSIREFENGFPVRLDFYRKGKHYFLQVTGKAWVVTDPEEMFTLSADTDTTVVPKGSDMVLVKVKIKQVKVCIK